MLLNQGIPFRSPIAIIPLLCLVFLGFIMHCCFLVSGPELLYLIQIAQKQTQQLTTRTKLGCFSTFPFADSFFFAGFVLFFFVVVVVTAPLWVSL